jgi:6-phosphogluconate dehydrogenase
MSSTRGYDIGLYGLAVMGQNFALNMASHGFSVAVCNRSPDKVDLTVKRAENEGKLPLYGFKNVSDFVNSLSKPRKVVILVQAGKPVDETIDKIAEFMEVCFSIDLILLSRTHIFVSL